MMITEELYNALNDLLGDSFECNAEADNIAYNLAYAQLYNIENIYHEHFAHVFPKIADKISDFMSGVALRAVRKPVSGFSKVYTDLEEMFSDNYEMVGRYCDSIGRAIGIANRDNSYAVSFFLNQLLQKACRLMAQASEWLSAAKSTTSIDLNINFDKFLQFIGD